MSERKLPGEVAIKVKKNQPLVGISPEELHAVEGARVIKTEYVSLDDLHARRAPKNAKKHRLDELNASMRRFGYTAPPMINEATGTLVAGHGRLDTLMERRRSGQPPPDGVFERDGKWLVPVIRGISFATDVEAVAYLMADNRLTEIGGNDWHLLREMATEVAATGEGLLGTGFVNVGEIEAQMEREVQGLLNGAGDLETGGLPSDDDVASDDNGKANVNIKFGQYSFFVDRATWSAWLDDVRLASGFDEESIKKEVRSRLGL